MKPIRPYLFLFLLLAGCSGPSLCDCDRETGKQDPDKEIVEECRELFSKMTLDEISTGLKKCKNDSVPGVGK